MSKRSRQEARRRGGSDPRRKKGLNHKRRTDAGFWVPMVLTVIAMLGLGFLFFPREDDSGFEFGVVEVKGNSLPVLGSGVDPALGSPIPEISGSDFSSRPVSIRDDGRPKAILFLAHWCPHCQDEVPIIRDWVEEPGPPSGVDLYSVVTSTDVTRPNYPPSEWLGDEKWNIDLVVDDEESSAARAFGLSGFPFWVFVRADGTLESRVAGELTTKELETRLKRIQGP